MISLITLPQNGQRDAQHSKRLRTKWRSLPPELTVSMTSSNPSLPHLPPTSSPRHLAVINISVISTSPSTSKLVPYILYTIPLSLFLSHSRSRLFLPFLSCLPFQNKITFIAIRPSASSLPSPSPRIIIHTLAKEQSPQRRSHKFLALRLTLIIAAPPLIRCYPSHLPTYLPTNQPSFLPS